MTQINFRNLTIDDYDAVYGYMSRYGEGSCQHSFVSMYSLAEKYGDVIAEENGFLYVLREKLCDEKYRVYLAPMGGGDLAGAYRNILNDAHAYGKKVRFITLTAKHKEFTEKAFPELFDYTEERDLAEYMFPTVEMASFSGKKMAKRRNELLQFWHTYEDRATVLPITPDDYEEILKYEQDWLKQNSETHDMGSLMREARMIEFQLRNFEKLHLSGIVMRVDGIVRGYGYGTKLSDLHYDAIIEKGDRDLVYPYRVLRQESVKQCAMDCKYVNMEEDLGIEGLRKIKLAYRPEYLLQKFTVTER